MSPNSNWHFIGLLAFVGAACAWIAPTYEASAQTFSTTITPAPRAQAVPQRRSGATLPVDPQEDPRDGSGETTPTGVAAQAGEVDPNDPTAPVDVDGDGQSDQPAIAVGARAVAIDGNLAPAAVPQPVDGAIEAPQAGAPVDGADATRVDTRSADDRAALESPPAGFDPSAFQAEIEPLLDRRPQQLFRFEPYQPIGIRVGQFTLLPEIETGLAAFSNVFLNSNARSTIAYEVRPSARLVSNWRVHALEFSATGGLTGLKEFSTQDERSYTLEARGRYDLSRRTTIEAGVSRGVTQDSLSSLDTTSTAANRGDVTTDRAAIALNHRFNRLSIQLRGAVADQTYSPTTDALGVVSSNLDRNNTRTEQAVRATWEFKPTLSAFAEVAINQTRYGAVAGDGLRRDSTGDRTRVGLAFGNTSQILRGEISIGYGRQRPEAETLEGIEGVIVDANLAWRVDAATSVLFSARSDVVGSTTAGTAGALSRTAGIAVRREVMRNLIATAGVSYGIQSYSGINLEEHTLTGTAGLEYFVDRNVSVFGRYQHVAFDATDSIRNYNADEVHVGLRLRR